MGEVPQLIKIGVSLKIQPNDGPVFFKVDGSRFGQNRTIKLLTGSKYKIEVIVKPGAVEASTMSIGGVTFPLEEQSKDPQSIVYQGIYDTEGVPHTKSGERQPIQVSIQDNNNKKNYQWFGMKFGRMIGGSPRMSWSNIGSEPEHILDSASGRIKIYLSNFTEAGLFETVWQVKFYNYHKRDHCQWGNSFGSIEYECKPNETRSLMWINKELFV